jgi:hypothetical protein
MKYSILAAFAESIPYIPGLRELTGSSSSAILMMQLEYWFSRYPEGFYKFLEPPQKAHNDYTPGDSWTEELAFGKEEFRAAFDKIGNRFNSKTQYEEAKQSGQEFGDKFYSSYFDRQSGLTYYHRDHERLNEFISRVQPRHKGVGKKARKKISQPQIQNPDHVVNSDLREIVDPNLQEMVISHMTISEDPIYGSGNFRFTDPYIYSEITPEITSEIKIKDPLTPKGGTGCLSEEGEGENLTGGGEERSPKPVEPPQAIQQGAPEQKSILSEDQISAAPTPIYSVHKKEHQARIVEIYQSNKPSAWLPVNNLHRDIRVMVDSLLSSENFQGDLEAFLTRLENALKEINDPTTKFGWFRNQGNLGLRTLLSNYGRHLMEFSDRWMERQTPQVRSDVLPDWALEAQKEIEARQTKKAG